MTRGPHEKLPIEGAPTQFTSASALRRSIDGLKRTVEPLAGLDVEQMNELASTVVPGLDSRVQALEDSRATNERIDGLERRVEDAESEAAAAKEGASDAATKAKFAIDKTRALEQYIDQLWCASTPQRAQSMPPSLCVLVVFHREDSLPHALNSLLRVAAVQSERRLARAYSVTSNLRAGRP